MILSDKDLKKEIKNGRLIIKPKIDEKTQLGACVIDLRLGNTFRVFNQATVGLIDPFDKTLIDRATSKVIVRKGAFILHPQEFVLAVTKEYLQVPDDLAGRLEGRSSIGRLGVLIHSTAANIEPGFRGNITLELANMGRIPVKLYPGMRICAISFARMSSPAKVPYYRKRDAKYVGQREPAASKIATEL